MPVRLVNFIAKDASTTEPSSAGFLCGDRVADIIRVVTACSEIEAACEPASCRPSALAICTSEYCLAAAETICVAVQPGGFELRTLVHLNETVQVLRQRINPRLAFAGAVLTNCHVRRGITEEVHAEVARHYTVLGQVRAEARLLYATTSGKVYHLVRSKALDDYRQVVERLKDVLPWLARK